MGGDKRVAEGCSKGAVCVLTDVFLFEFPRSVSLDECCLADTAITDEDELELGCVRVGLCGGSSLTEEVGEWRSKQTRNEPERETGSLGMQGWTERQ